MHCIITLYRRHIAISDSGPEFEYFFFRLNRISWIVLRPWPLLSSAVPDSPSAAPARLCRHRRRCHDEPNDVGVGADRVRDGLPTRLQLLQLGLSRRRRHPNQQQLPRLSATLWRARRLVHLPLQTASQSRALTSGKTRWAEAGRCEPRWAEVGRGGPRRADAGRGEPRQAEVSRGEPRWAEAGRGEPRRAETGRGEPSWAEAGRSGPRWADVSRGGPRQADASRGEPRWAEVGRCEPRWAEVAYMRCGVVCKHNCRGCLPNKRFVNLATLK